MNGTFTDYLQKTSAQLDVFFSEIFRRDPVLEEIFSYSVLGGGKKFRPALLTAAAESLGTPGSAVIQAAAAMELVHAFSLVHDDMPCMDNDDMRRGKPSCHRRFGEGNALLAGDGLLILAFRLLSEISDGVLAARLTQELAKASLDMVQGQYLELNGGDKPDARRIMEVHRLKTGALITGALRMGALAAGASPQDLAAVTEYGGCLGLLFQITDDLLDREEENLASAAGETHCRDLARQCAEKARRALEGFSGRSGLFLEAVDFLLQRKE